MTQLGFDDLLANAAQDNAAHAFAKETAHLPETFEEAVAYFEELIRRHDQAMRIANVETAMELREDAQRLARKLNKGDPGILAHDDAPAYQLERACAPKPGCAPLWGQAGTFVISVQNIEVEVELNGVFGIGACFHFWPGFAARAVDHKKPFLSATGYRSFLGLHAEPQEGLSPEQFAEVVIDGYVRNELRGKLVQIDERYHR